MPTQCGIGLLQLQTFFQQCIFGSCWSTILVLLHRYQLPNRTPKYPNFEVPNAAIDYFFVCDNAFPLAKHLMKPYPSRNLSEERQLFNYRLSRARRISENVFGLLASRFHVFHTMMM